MSNVFAAENTGARIYKVGRVGLDTGTEDSGGVYTMRLKSEKLSPAGEGGLCSFRRVLLRAFHTGSFSGQIKVYVDGVQTQILVSDVLTNQVFAFSEGTPVNSPAEALVEMDIEASGSIIEVEVLVDSDAVVGTFLPESIWVGYRAIRPGRQREASVS